MRDISNILTGLVAALLGGAMILWTIPSQTVPAIFASVPSGFYPTFTSGMLVASGLALVVSGLFSTSGTAQAAPRGFAARLALAFVLLVGAMYAAPIAGFLPTGVIICLIVLILMRERRWPLIAAICVAAPLAVWGGFELLLGRPLP